MSDAFDNTIRARLIDLAASLPPEAESRVLAIDYIPRATRRRRLRAVWSTCSVALTAGIGTVVLLIASVGSATLSPLVGTSYSLAGWTSIPASAASSPVFRAAVRSCDQSVASFAASFTGGPQSVASVQNVLTDVRGKYAAVVSIDREASYVCVNGERAQQGLSTSRSKGIPAAAEAGALSPAYVAHYGGSGFVNGRRVTGLGAGNHAYGRAGSDVSAVLFGFRNGRTVSATVEHGWYFAWWPWGSAPTSAQVTNSSGTVRSRTNCRPGSSGCVFSGTPKHP